MKLSRLLPASTLGFVSILLCLTGCPSDDTGDEVGSTDATDTTDTTDTSTSADTTDTSAALSYAADIQPIWDMSCVAGCHTPGGSAATVLDLSGDSYAKVVDVNSTQAIGKKLVATGDSANSYLIAKMEGNQAAAGGTGGNMPSGADMLPAATLQTIKDWIDAGAAM